MKLARDPRPGRGVVLAVLAILSSLSPSQAASGAPDNRDALIPPRALVAGDAQASAEAAIEHLRQVMDLYHSRFPVYDDISSGGNHFHVWAKVANDPASAPVEMLGSSTDSPHSGATAIRCEFRAGEQPWAGFYFLNGVLAGDETEPSANWGGEPEAGIDLSGAIALTFWARGDTGGERIEFFVGGVGRDPWGNPIEPYPDSSPKIATPVVELTDQWAQYTLSFDESDDLSYVLGGFGWVTTWSNNPTGAVFYLDDIQYELGPAARAARLDEPRFLRSYTTAPVQSAAPPVGDFDLRFRNAATTYDNALALLAFLAHGSEDSLRRARLIGDAFVYAAGHDRFYDDGRLRDMYSAGDRSLPPGWEPHGQVGTVPVPGFFDEGTGTFVETGQEGISTGNQAWAMIALLALYERTGAQAHLDAALDLARFIQEFRNTSGTYQGFLGGLDAPESEAPVARPWASTEHNLDIYAGFSSLFQITGDVEWQQDAQHARELVQAMWDESLECNRAGTLDPETPNEEPGMLPVDVQAWHVLAEGGILATRPELLACAEIQHRVDEVELSGFDFNDDKDGIWFEGSAQMAAAHIEAGNGPEANALRAMLRTAQTTVPYGDGLGLAASSSEALTTGFGSYYFQRLHIGASAWHVFAQLGFNPFYATDLFPTLSVTREGSGSGAVSSDPPGIDCGTDCSEVYELDVEVSLVARPEVGSTFAGWGGDADCSDGLVTMESDAACVATFDLQAFDLTVEKVGSGSGTVSSEPPGLVCGPLCGQDTASFDFGTVVTLTAEAEGGSAFLLWAGDADCADGNWTMEADTRCKAHFCMLDLILTDRTIGGTETFEACQTITVGPAVEVSGTGELLLRAGQRVALRSGFSVAMGGRARIEIAPELVPP